MMLTIKKSLGQHFLKDEAVLDRIMEELTASPFDRLLEVGPGAGALTRRLLSLHNVDLRCVELDHEKVVYLEKMFPALRGKLIEGDVLTMEKPFNERFTVVGNFPYNISSQILFRLLDWKDSVEAMVGMFQKEVAQRVAAKEGSRIYGVTSVLVQAFFKVEYLFEVPETAFDPPPKVQSAVIRLVPQENVPTMRSERHFRQLVKAGFGQRRKTLRNALKGMLDADVLTDALFNKRAEELSVADFASLTFRMK